MRRFLLFLSSVFLLAACQTEVKRCAIPYLQRHKQLSSFDIQYNNEIPMSAEDTARIAKASGGQYKMVNSKHGPIYYLHTKVHDCGNYHPDIRIQGDTLFLEYQKYGCNECSYKSDLTLTYEIDDPSLPDYVVFFNGNLLREDTGYKHCVCP